MHVSGARALTIATKRNVNYNVNYVYVDSSIRIYVPKNLNLLIFENVCMYSASASARIIQYLSMHARAT